MLGTYNPVVDLVIGAVLILVPLFVLASLGLGLIVSSKEGPGEAAPLSTKREEEILQALENLHDNQEKFLNELRDLSEENRHTLQSLLAETNRLRDLLRADLEETPGQRLSDWDRSKN
jgi:hypothetical protein